MTALQATSAAMAKNNSPHLATTLDGYRRSKLLVCSESYGVPHLRHGDHARGSVGKICSSCLPFGDYRNAAGRVQSSPTDNGRTGCLAAVSRRKRLRRVT